MNIALILASGIGSRLNSNIPKQFIRINNIPLLIMTLETFNKSKSIDKIIIVTLKDHATDVNNLVKEFKINKVTNIVAGGSTRQESSYNGVMSLINHASADDIILIHDAARVLVDSTIIENNILAAKIHGAAITAIKSTDTIFISQIGDKLDNTTNRDEMYIAQTPQTFKLEIIKKAHEFARKNNINNVSDDAQLVRLINQDIKVVNGSPLNFKVTTDFDLAVLKMIINK